MGKTFFAPQKIVSTNRKWKVGPASNKKRSLEEAKSRRRKKLNDLHFPMSSMNRVFDLGLRSGLWCDQREAEAVGNDKVNFSKQIRSVNNLYLNCSQFWIIFTYIVKKREKVPPKIMVIVLYKDTEVHGTWTDNF